MKETNRRRNSTKASQQNTSDYESFYRGPWESDELESNIKEIECNLFRLMDNEKEQMARRQAIPIGKNRMSRRRSGNEENVSPLEYSAESLNSFESPANGFSHMGFYDSDLSLNLSTENNFTNRIETTPSRANFFYTADSSPIQYSLEPSQFMSPKCGFLSPLRRPNLADSYHEPQPAFYNHKYTPANHGQKLNSTPYQAQGYHAMAEQSPKVMQHSKKSVKMTVPSNKRQVLEEEFRKEKYPCNEKLQKLSIKLNMKYEEVQNYFKKRRREEKETNNKFSILVNMLNNYLEQE